MWKRDSPSASARHSFVESKFDNPQKSYLFSELMALDEFK